MNDERFYSTHYPHKFDKPEKVHRTSEEHEKFMEGWQNFVNQVHCCLCACDTFEDIAIFTQIGFVCRECWQHNNRVKELQLTQKI